MEKITHMVQFMVNNVGYFGAHLLEVHFSNTTSHSKLTFSHTLDKEMFALVKVGEFRIFGKQAPMHSLHFLR